MMVLNVSKLEDLWELFNSLNYTLIAKDTDYIQSWNNCISTSHWYFAIKKGCPTWERGSLDIIITKIDKLKGLKDFCQAYNLSEKKAIYFLNQLYQFIETHCSSNEKLLIQR